MPDSSEVSRYNRLVESQLLHYEPLVDRKETYYVNVYMVESVHNIDSLPDSEYSFINGITRCREDTAYDKASKYLAAFTILYNHNGQVAALGGCHGFSPQGMLLSRLYSNIVTFAGGNEGMIYMALQDFRNSLTPSSRIVFCVSQTGTVTCISDEYFNPGIMPYAEYVAARNMSRRK